MNSYHYTERRPKIFNGPDILRVHLEGSQNLYDTYYKPFEASKDGKRSVTVQYRRKKDITIKL